MITYITVNSDNHIHQILSLQQQNLAGNLTEDQRSSQGFVSLVHTFDVLKRMNAVEPSIIGLDEDKIAGYCLAMTEAFKEEFPDLRPMYKEIAAMQAMGEIKEGPYIAIGQVCVAQEYRGQGVFDNLYNAFREKFNGRYAFAATEISSRNKRSLQAHTRLGFRVVFSHPGGEWLTVVWDWLNNKR